MSNNKTILVSPLDWGLGHATRCIPLIHSFLKENHLVVIATTGLQKALLQEEFPRVEFIDLPGYDVHYPKNASMATTMLLQLPKIRTAIKQEHDWLKSFCEGRNIDLIISDNRYGFWHKNIKSVLISHQIFLKAPRGEWVLEKLLKNYLDNFHEIWIPDFEHDNNLSGDLSHKKPLAEKYKFIGPLSRFSNDDKLEDNNGFKYDFMAIISGPEPQRSIFEELLLKQTRGSGLKGVVVRGLPDNNSELRMSNEELQIFNHLPKAQFLDYFLKSKTIVCRSGYSTIMDLHVLNRKALLIPTPGQTEQEYLAKYHSEKNGFVFQRQSDLHIKKGIGLLN